MNKQRRRSIRDIINQLTDLQVSIETLKDEEQEYLDNMPEGLQAGDKGSAAQEAIDALEESMAACETASDALQEALDALRTAAQ